MCHLVLYIQELETQRKEYIMTNKSEIIKLIRIRKNVGLPAAIKIYNTMSESDKQRFLENIAIHTMYYK